MGILPCILASESCVYRVSVFKDTKWRVCPKSNRFWLVLSLERSHCFCHVFMTYRYVLVRNTFSLTQHVLSGLYAVNYYFR